MATQTTAPIEVTTVLGDDSFQLRSLHWEERLGYPFEGKLVLVSDTANIDLQSLLKTPASVRVDGPGGTPSYFNGYIAKAENLGPEIRQTRYSVTLVPAIALLRHSGGCRIFQEFTVIDIVKKIFSNFGFSGELEMRLSGEYEKRDYCVQYCESDFNFLHRILQSEGIYYFFEYSEEKHCMVLADDVQAHASASGNETILYRPTKDTRLDEFLTELKTSRKFVTGAVELGDYDFEKPRAKLTAKQASAEGDAQWTRYHYPGEFTETDRGQALAKLRQQSWDAAAVDVRFEGNPRRVRAGNVFELSEHPESEHNVEYLVTETRTSASLAAAQAGLDSEFSFAVEIAGQPSKVPFRSALSASSTSILGPHVAVVTGKADEEIWTDKYGRIKVQFPWDPDGGNDENSSCWVRVAQPWTGKTWGAMSLPRIGEEVIVQFVDGNPDRPIVVGRLNNADMMPPDALGEAQSKTVLRTHSTKGGDQTNFHELGFDDTKDSEEIYFHSERDFKRVVENNDLLRVGFEKQTPGDQAVAIYNNQTIDIGQGGEDGSLTLNVQNNRTSTISGGNDTTTVSEGDLSISVESGSATIEAATSIELKCGESTIKLTPSQISIQSDAITVEATNSLSLKGMSADVEASTELNLKGSATANLNSSGQLTVKGAMVMIN